MKPKIAIIVCGLSENRQFVTNSYVQAVRYSGGLPLIIPLVKSNVAIHEYISLCDGFLFCGGGDITPLLFGQEPVDKLGETNITLDIFQLRYAPCTFKRKTRSRHLPGNATFKCCL